MEAEPVQFLWRRYEERLEPARAELARFVGARTRDLVFVTNATSAVNAVVRSLKLSRGDELLTTNHDYNACHNVLVEEARCTGAKLRVATVPFPIRNDDEVVEAILSAVTRRTRLALIDHVTSNTALIFPVRKTVRELESRGVDIMIDGAHAPGMLPLNLSSLSPAYYTGNLHKWVCAPKGAAFLWAREDKQANLQPAVISHGNNTPRPGFTQFQDRFDWAGTSDPTAWFCVGEAIQFLGRLLPGGWSELQKRNHQLAVQARDILCSAWHVQGPCPDAMLGSMATVPLPQTLQKPREPEKIDPGQTFLYDAFRIEVPFMRAGIPELRCVRVSAHLYNTIQEYRFLAQAVRAVRS
jgi:isopenicillin-N epimerase